MKYKVKKYEGGGGFALFTPIPNMASQETTSGAAPTQGSAPSSEENGSPLTLLDKKSYEELLTKGGLINDVNHFVDQLAEIESMNSNPFLSKANRSMAYTVIKKINQLKQSKENWKEAVQTATQSGGLNEVAIGTSGEVFIKDENDTVKAISLQTYAKNKDNFKLLTTGELLDERQRNRKLVGQDGIITVAANSIGLNKIIDHIQNLIGAIGTETSETSNYYSKNQARQYLTTLQGKTPTPSEQESLAKLNTILNSPGELSQLTSTEVTQRKYVSQALRYIWTTLGSAAQQKLRAVAVMNNDTPDNVIMSMLIAGTNHSSKMEVVPKDIDGSSLSGDGSSGSKTDKVGPLTPQELFYNDRLRQPGMTYEINTPKTGMTLNATATAIGPLYSLLKAGEVLGPKPITSILTENNFLSILDPSHAYIGDNKVDPMLFSQAAYTGEEVAKVYLPVKSDGTPDLGQMESFQKAYELFDANKDTWNTEQIKAHFKRSGFSNISIKEQQNSDGTFSKVIAENNRVKPFLALPVISNSASDLASNPWMLESMGEKEATDEMIMKNAFSVLGGTASKPKINNTMPKAFLSLEVPHRGVMFIAFRPTAPGILASMNGHVTGRKVTEQDIYRNLNHSNSENYPNGIISSASYL